MTFSNSTSDLTPGDNHLLNNHLFNMADSSTAVASPDLDALAKKNTNLKQRIAAVKARKLQEENEALEAELRELEGDGKTYLPYLSAREYNINRIFKRSRSKAGGCNEVRSTPCEEAEDRHRVSQKHISKPFQDI